MSTATLTPAVAPAPARSRAAILDRALWPVAALTALAAVLRFSGLGGQSYWFDESVTVVLTHLSLGQMLTAIPHTETTPPLYYVLAWAWTHVTGAGPVALRSVSAAAGTLTVPVVALTARQLSGRRAGLIAGGLAACNPLLVWYSQEARAYALLVLCCAATLWCCAHLRSDPSSRWARRWALAASAALWTHYFAVIVVVPQALWLVVRHRRCRAVRLALAGVVAAGTVVLPLAVKQVSDLESAGDWLRQVPLAHRIGDVPRTFITGPQTVLGGAQLALATLVIGVAVWCAARRMSGAQRRTIALPAGCALAAVALVAAALAAGHDELDYRNLLPLWLPCALALAGALGARRAGRLGVAAACVLCTSGLAAVVAVKVDSRLQRPDWHALATTLGTRPDRAIVIRNGCQLLPLSLYLPGLHTVGPGGTTASELDVVTPAGGATWTDVLETDWYIQCSRTRPGDAAAPALPGFTAVGAARHVDRFTVVRLRAPHPVNLSAAVTARAGLSGELLATPAPGR